MPIDRRERGRGARVNPAGRFERARLEPDLDRHAPEPPPPRPTEAIPDPTRTILATNQSPDIPFETSLNPYRGCEHGCAYCYARPSHEYLGYSAGLDFETKILVKEKAPELLRRALAAPRWKPQVVALSGVTDAYQPLERTARAHATMRRGLRGVPQSDHGHHQERARGAGHRPLQNPRRGGCRLGLDLSITTLDGALQRALEPRASSPGRAAARGRSDSRRPASRSA